MREGTWFVTTLMGAMSVTVPSDTAAHLNLTIALVNVFFLFLHIIFVLVNFSWYYISVSVHVHVRIYMYFVTYALLQVQVCKVIMPYASFTPWPLFRVVLYTDINECELGSHNCSDNASCSDNEGGFNCTCNDGFIGDGWNCSGMYGEYY